MTFDEACARLRALARLNGGVLTAATVEADPELAAEQSLVCAAARSLAAATNVFADDAGDDDRGWFPYTAVRFTDLRG
jgi:hypothetical protein